MSDPIIRVIISQVMVLGVISAFMVRHLCMLLEGERTTERYISFGLLFITMCFVFKIIGDVALLTAM